MKVEELLDELGLTEDQIDIVVEPETSLKKLNEFEKKYNYSSQMVYNLVKKQGIKNEVLEEWAYQYYKFIKYDGDEEELYYNQCFYSSQGGQDTDISEPDQNSTTDQVSLCQY